MIDYIHVRTARLANNLQLSRQLRPHCRPLTQFLFSGKAPIIPWAVPGCQQPQTGTPSHLRRDKQQAGPRSAFGWRLDEAMEPVPSLLPLVFSCFFSCHTRYGAFSSPPQHVPSGRHISVTPAVLPAHPQSRRASSLPQGRCHATRGLAPWVPWRCANNLAIHRSIYWGPRAYSASNGPPAALHRLCPRSGS